MIIAFGRGFRLTELKKPPSDKRYGIMPVQSIKSASFTPCTLRSCSTVNEGEGERERERQGAAVYEKTCTNVCILLANTENERGGGGGEM